MKHCGWARRGSIPEWRPGVKRPERDKDPKTKQQQRKNKVLRGQGEPVLSEVFCQRRNVEGVASRLQVERNQANQSNQCADAQINGNLPGRLRSLLAASP